MMSGFCLRLAMVCVSIIGFPALAADAVDPLFQSLKPLDIIIEGPLEALEGDRSEEPEERPGRLVLERADADTVAFDVGLEPRGKSRRQRDVCVFPPLWVDFKRKAVRDTVFANQNRLKLVTHCGLSSRYEQHLLREYLAYRILNLITDRSFRVRLLQVDYQETGSDESGSRKPGFFIEHQRRLAERLGLTYEKLPGIEREALDPEHASLIELFQYLIGNVDFSLVVGPEGESCCHNAKLFRDPQGAMLAVPYDFDMSGFVDPPYGFPNRELRQRSLRQRIYRGYCRAGDAHERAVARFREKRQEILALLTDQAELESRTRRKLVDYVEDFYDVLDNPKKLNKRVLEACRYPL
jgi:hypothetical protein